MLDIILRVVLESEILVMVSTQVKKLQNICNGICYSLTAC